MTTRIALSTLFAMAVACTAPAKTCIWTGGGTPDSNGLYWSDAGNWEDGNVPASGDTVCITNTTAYNSVCNIPNLTLPHLVHHSNGTGSSKDDVSLNVWNRIKLTGTGNIISASTKTVYIYSLFELAEGAKVTITASGDATMCIAKNDMFTGKGTVDVSLTGNFQLGYKLDNFEGTLNILKCGSVYLVSGNVGGDKMRINSYAGFNDNGAQHTMRGEYHFYAYNDGTKVVVPSFYSQFVTTFKGDVYLHALSDGNSFAFNPYGRTFVDGKQRDAGFIFDGDIYTVNDEKQAALVFYTYGITGSTSGHNDSILTFNGVSHMGKNSAGVGTAISISYQHAATGSIITVANTIESTADYIVQFLSGTRLYTTAPNVLPRCRPRLGNANTSVYGALLDIMGNDQTVASPLNQISDGYEKDFTFKSSGRPGTLSIGISAAVADRVFYPKLNDKISIVFRKPSQNLTSSITFSQDGDTDGWISTLSAGLDFNNISFPNISGVSITEAAPLYIQTTASLNPAMEIDVTGSTATGPVRVSTGKNQTVKRVLIENVDIPTDTYCRTGAGVEGATEAAWMGAGTTAADWNGTITISAHDPMAVWTGNGSSTTFLDPANWGGNAAPDLSDPSLTVNFKNAAGNEGMVVPLDGTVSPAGAVSLGGYSKGSVTFGGTGTLVVGDEGATATNELAMVFTDSSSFTWNGAGTLYLKGRSTSTGTLRVGSGKVVMEYASWPGNVVVAQGAELVVSRGCGSDVFGAAADNACSFVLNGKLTLENGVATTVKALNIAGALARRDRTYGSTESAAERTDDARFGGTGTIVSQAMPGLTIILN